MSQTVFIELYLDEDVDVLVADLLRARGFVAVTTRDAGQLGSSDQEQLAYAASQAKTFLTHNRADFEALARAYTAQEKRTAVSSWPCAIPLMKSCADF